MTVKNISFKKDPDKKYDESARNLAKRKCTIIYLVVIYILYQVYGIIHSKVLDETTMTWTGVIVASAILIVGSLSVAVFATIKMGRELYESEITEDEIPVGDTIVDVSDDISADDTATDVADEILEDETAVDAEGEDTGDETE